MQRWNRVKYLAGNVWSSDGFCYTMTVNVGYVVQNAASKGANYIDCESLSVYCLQQRQGVCRLPLLKMGGMNSCPTIHCLAMSHLSHLKEQTHIHPITYETFIKLCTSPLPYPRKCSCGFVFTCGEASKSVGAQFQVLTSYHLEAIESGIQPSSNIPPGR